jgi:hypothetical protein
MTKCPEVVVQLEASTDIAAVHYRASDGGSMAESWASLITNAGLHIG